MNRFDKILDKKPTPTAPTREYRQGERFRIKGQVYTYAYRGQTGKAILYEEGEENMQDAIAVDFSELTDPC